VYFILSKDAKQLAPYQYPAQCIHQPFSSAHQRECQTSRYDLQSSRNNFQTSNHERTERNLHTSHSSVNALRSQLPTSDEHKIEASVPLSRHQRTSKHSKTTLLLRMTEISESFIKLNTSYIKKAVYDLQAFYVNKSSEVENNRYSSLRAAADNASLKKSIDHEYDEEHHKLIDRVQRSISLLEERSGKVLREKTNRFTSSTTKITPVALQIMTNWYDLIIQMLVSLRINNK